MIDLRRLRVLRAVDHYGTVTAAAEALHFTPSAASQQIRQLARELDVTLLEPSGRRVRLTPAARSLIEHADAIHARWEQAEIELRACDGQPSGPLRMSGFPVAVATLLAPLAAALRARHPRLSVHIQETELRDSFDLLFEGEVDLAIIEVTSANPPAGDARFDQRPLLDDAFDLVVSADHPFARREHVALAEASGEEWIISVASTCREHTYTACSAAGFTPRVGHHALEWNAVANLIAHRLGVALIPRLAHLAPHLPIVRIPLHGNPRPVRKLLTCTRTGGHRNPAVAAALEELRRIGPATVSHPPVRR